MRCTVLLTTAMKRCRVHRDEKTRITRVIVYLKMLPPGSEGFLVLSKMFFKQVEHFDRADFGLC